MLNLKNHIHSVASAALAILSLLLIFWLRPEFTLAIGDACDSWYYFGINHLWDQVYNSPQYYYYNDRIPAIWPRHLFNSQLPFPFGRTLYIFVLHSLSLVFLCSLFSKIFRPPTVWLLLLLYALSPLAIGTLHTDYIAIEAHVYTLLTLVLILKSSTAHSARKQWVLLGIAGFVYGLAFHSHFKVMLYSLYFLPLVIVAPDQLKLRRSWLSSGAAFSLGFLSTTGFLILAHLFWLEGWDWYFFKDQVRVSFADESEFMRPLFVKMENSPGPSIYAFTVATFLSLKGRLMRQPLFLGGILQILFILFYAAFGGNIFVMSNYIWLVPPAFLVLGAWIDSVPFKSSWIAFALATLAFPLFLVTDFPVYDWIFDRIGYFYPFAIAAVLWLYLKTSTLRPTLYPVSLFIVFCFLFSLRPDFKYGIELFYSEPHSYAHASHYQEAVAILNTKADVLIDPSYQLFSDEEDRPSHRMAQNSLVQCGPRFRPSFRRVAEFVKLSLQKSRKVLFISKNEDPTQGIILFKTIGIETEPLFKRKVPTQEEQWLHVFLIKNILPEYF